MKRDNLKIYVALTFVSILYGINYSAIKVVVPDYIGAYGFILYRILIASTIFWAINVFKMEKIDWKADGIRIVLCAFTGAGINQLTFFKGMSLTSAVNGSIIMTLTPVLVLIWAYFLLREKITGLKVLGILIGMIGAIIIIYKQKAVGVSGDLIGDIFVFINSVTYACYLVLVKPLIKKYRPMTVMTWIFSIGFIFVFPVGIQEAVEVQLGEMPMNAWIGAGYAIILVTIIAYFLNAWALTKVDSSVVGAFIYLQPVIATLTAILFFNEIFLIKHLIAAAFVFTGVWLVTKKSS